ncbi:MAG: universal stress protein [Candidatus Wallbacteria bacterium]|nr:universal stress protein [Candidatus Wallbacteria bacterium]
MLRSVLVCLDSSPENRPCQTTALALAGGYGATLLGLFVRELPASLAAGPAYPASVAFPGEPFMVYPEPEAQLQARIREFEERQSTMEDLALRPFMERARVAGVRAHAEIRSGEIVAEIALAARAADLTVMGRGTGESESLLGSVAASLVRSVARPFLLVGETVEALGPIVVAYDGSSGAQKALAAAADLACQWKPEPLELILLTINPGQLPPADDPLAAPAYLDAYGIRFRKLDVEGRPADAITRVAERENAGLLCMGAYGHWIVREMLLGSTTQQVVARWKRPLLLCH